MSCNVCVMGYIHYIFTCVLNSTDCIFAVAGRSYAVNCQRALLACLESLVQKCQSGVVVNFEKIGPDAPGNVNLCSNLDFV